MVTIYNFVDGQRSKPVFYSLAVFSILTWPVPASAQDILNPDSWLVRNSDGSNSVCRHNGSGTNCEIQHSSSPDIYSLDAPATTPHPTPKGDPFAAYGPPIAPAQQTALPSPTQGASSSKFNPDDITKLLQSGGDRVVPAADEAQPQTALSSSHLPRPKRTTAQIEPQHEAQHQQ